MAATDIVVFGGSGRVGSSTIQHLLSQPQKYKIAVAGRSTQKFQKAKKNRQFLQETEFRTCDINDQQRVKSAVKNSKLILHAAGPFQNSQQGNFVLEAALEHGIPYIDICDDTKFSERAKDYHLDALKKGVPCITSAGIYPGLSNLLASEMINLQQKDDPDAQPSKVSYCYYTAGSGGVGPTILESTLGLIGQKVRTFENGRQVIKDGFSDRKLVDFGEGKGLTPCYLLNLPETASTFATLKVPSVQARFGTAPNFWNYVLEFMARQLPAEVFQSREKVKFLAAISDPFVRVVDLIVGEEVGIRVNLLMSNGKRAASLFRHQKLSESVGICTAAFCQAMLEGDVEPGVWFPEEKNGIKNKRKIIDNSLKGTKLFQLNVPLWKIEEDKKKLGMGLYI